MAEARGITRTLWLLSPLLCGLQILMGIPGVYDLVTLWCTKQHWEDAPHDVFRLTSRQRKGDIVKSLFPLIFGPGLRYNT